jgi:hypothetical protein
MARKETIRIYRSDVAGAVPSLTAGEIAVNLQDKKLFVGGTNGTATDLQFLDQSQQITVKGVGGTIQFANASVNDLQADSGLKYNFLTDNSFEVPAGLRLGSYLAFGDGTTQSTAYTGLGVDGVESINGCTGAFTITGTVNEVVVSTGINCRNIIIGLPDSVTIPYISSVGATFTGTVTASRLVGHVDGGVY